MTISKREQALQGLFLILQGLSGPVVKRNEPLPSKVVAEGLVILRDGDVGEPEIILSPTRYIYQHRAEIEVLVQKANQAERDTALDTILQSIGTALAADPTLGGVVDYMAPGAPELMEETVEGAPTLKAAVVPVILEYATTNPLQ